MKQKRSRPESGQAALEFLMTYGWAIIVVAIMLALLFQIGIFTTATAVVKVPPGSCQVQKTSIGPDLTGLCQGQLPEFVMSFNSPGAWNFNCADQGSCIAIPDPAPANSLVCNFTISGWSYDTGMGANGTVSGPYQVWVGGTGANPSAPSLGGVFSVFNGSPSLGAIDVEYNDTIIRYELRNSTSRNQLFYQGNFKDKWVFTALVMTGGVATAYFDGVPISPASKNIGCIQLTTGVIGTWDRNFAGQISNVQIYNTSLSTKELSTLYTDGIGGPPLKLTNLIAWYPLNGNPYDYSGDNKDGTINLISNSGTWTSSYTPV